MGGWVGVAGGGGVVLKTFTDLIPCCIIIRRQGVG